MVSLLVGVGLAAILLAHGVVWWSAPIAIVAAVVLGHLVALAGLVGLSALMTGHGELQARGTLIRRPQLYDWMAGVFTGGHEAQMRGAWLDIADLREGEAVLDVGCGTGTLLVAAAQKIGPRGTFCGIEAAPEMAARARDKARSAGVDAEIITGFADTLPFADDSFDVVFSTLVFHHLPPDVQLATLKEIRRVLRAEGRVVIVDFPHHHGHDHAPRTAGLWSLLSLVHTRHEASGRVVDIDAALNDLGAREVTQHPGGVGGLRATRAVFG